MASRADIDVLVGGVDTNRQARSVLGEVARFLRRGYEAVERYTDGVDLGLYDDAQANARDLLDRTNRAAQALYAKMPDDDGALDEALLPQLAELLYQAQSSLELLRKIGGNLYESFGAWVASSAKLGTGAVGGFVSSAAAAAGDIFGSAWKIWVPLLGVAVLVLVFKKKVSA